MPPRYRLSLRGAVRLQAPDGADVTPRGAKAQAMLAILASSRGRPWNRAALQDLLWSTRGPQHGRDSLKKCLREIRLALGAEGDAVIQSSGGPVALSMDRVSVDLFEPDPEAAPGLHRPEFLEGLDVADPEFERWLQGVRTTLAATDDAQVGAAPDGMERVTQLRIALQALTARPGDTAAAALADIVINRVAVALRHYEVFQVLDLRDAPDGEAPAADFVLQTRVLSMHDSVGLSLTVRRVFDGEVVWGEQCSVDVAGLVRGTLAALVSRIVDQLSAALFRPAALGATERRIAARHAIDGMNRMFRLHAPELAAAARCFACAIDADPRGPYYAWYAFLTCFRLEDSKGSDLAELREHADAIAARALEADPANILTRSLLTHVYGFVFRDLNRADALMRPLRDLEPDLPYYHFSRAMLDFYRGDYRGARAAAARAYRTGRHGPFGYAFATACQMIELAEGNTEAAVTFGEDALNVASPAQRLYEPALRFQIAAYARQGDVPNAQRIWQRMLDQTPGLTSDALDDDAFPIPNPEARAMIRHAMREVETRDAQ